MKVGITFSKGNSGRRNRGVHQKINSPPLGLLLPPKIENKDMSKMNVDYFEEILPISDFDIEDF